MPNKSIGPPAFFMIVAGQTCLICCAEKNINELCLCFLFAVLPQEVEGSKEFDKNLYIIILI